MPFRVRLYCMGAFLRGSSLSDVYQAYEDFFVLMCRCHWESIHSGLADVTMVLVSSSSRLDLVAAILFIKSKMVITVFLECSIKITEDAFFPT